MGGITAVPASWEFPTELRERATRLTLEALSDPDRAKGCFKRVGDQLDVNSEALRGWVHQAQVDQGERPGITTADQQRIRELEGEVRELRRANAILRSASAFVAAEPGRPSH